MCPSLSITLWEWRICTKLSRKPMCISSLRSLPVVKFTHPVKTLLAMDAGTVDGDLLFIAGHSEPDEVTKQTSSAIIGCINLAYHLTPVCQYKLQNPRYTGASSIRRIRASANEFLVGVMHAVVVVYFDINTFREITTFDNLHSGRLG